MKNLQNLSKHWNLLVTLYLDLPSLNFYLISTKVVKKDSSRKLAQSLFAGETLAKIALELGLEKLVIMDEKGMRNGWNNNPKIL